MIDIRGINKAELLVKCFEEAKKELLKDFGIIKKNGPKLKKIEKIDFLSDEEEQIYNLLKDGETDFENLLLKTTLPLIILKTIQVMQITRNFSRYTVHLQEYPLQNVWDHYLQ